MRRGTVRFDNKKRTQKDAITALVLLLIGCREEALAEFTPEGLHSSYGLPVSKCSEMLAQARRSRGVAA